MNQLEDPALFKVLGHPQRYAILKHLMATKASLTQLGEAFNQSPAHIRHHLKILENAGLVELAERRTVQGGPEKYYRATQRAMIIRKAILPELPSEKLSITISSMDSGVQFLAEFLNQRQLPFNLLPIPLSSLDGLIALRQGLCQMSACHLISPQTDEYNRSFIRHLFPGQSIALIKIYRREEGLIVPPGNPLRLNTLEDLARENVRLVNREPGSGVRQWFDLELERAGLKPEQLQGYTHIVGSHDEVARAVRAGVADTGIGILSSARKFGLDFVPLYEEPYEIAVPAAILGDDRYAALFEVLNSGEFRTAIQKLDGYIVPGNSGDIEVVH